MLDRSKIGHEFAPFTVEIEKGRLRFFARAIGETNPIYVDAAAASAAGHATIPAPPTYMFSIDLEGPEFLPIVKLLGLDIPRVLHGSQEFDYLAQIYAGDVITQTSKIADIFDKKGGALEFVVVESVYTNESREPVGKARQTLVYRSS